MTLYKNKHKHHTSSADNYLGTISFKNFSNNNNNNNNNNNHHKNEVPKLQGHYKFLTHCSAMTETLHGWYKTVWPFYTKLQSHTQTKDRTQSVQNLPITVQFAACNSAVKLSLQTALQLKLSTPSTLWLLIINHARKLLASSKTVGDRDKQAYCTEQVNSMLHFTFMAAQKCAKQS